MKKKITCAAILITIVMIAMSALCGCGSSAPDPKKKYVVFENIYGDEEYTVWYPNSTYKVECEYDEHKEYYFYYRAYYRDNDVPTGETGYVPVTIKGNEPGTYTVSAYINLDSGGNNRSYTVKITIKEKPDLRVMPEVRFDPNGATLEERDGETVYVYKYDTNEHFPQIQLFYDEQEIELDLFSNGIASVKYNGEHYRYSRPREIGEYEIEYWIYGNQYANNGQEMYHSVTVYILVEIQE